MNNARVKVTYKLVDIGLTDKSLTLQRKDSKVVVYNPDTHPDLELERDPEVIPWYAEQDWEANWPGGEPPMIEEPVDTMVKAFDEGYPVELEVSFEKAFGREEKFMIHRVIVHKKPEIHKSAIDISEIEFLPIDYVSLKVGELGYAHIQSDGYLLYAGGTGEGKTYFAINNIPRLIEKFGKVVILAYEISPRDYLSRLSKMLKISPEEVKNRFKGKIIIETELNIGKLKNKYAKDEKLAFIVDNVDNLPLEMDGDSFFQALWLKQFDSFLKDKGYFAIILSQMKKQQEKIKKDESTQYDVAGSKERVDLSRSAIFTWYDELTKTYSYKPLKLGSMDRPNDSIWTHRQ